MKQSKSFEIPKRLVWESYQSMRKNRGAPGFDGETVAKFDKNRNRTLYKIWNRLSSGTYFPPPVLEKSIPKADGGIRILGIPTVEDRVAQGAVKIYLESIVEPIFSEDSYGYRPGKSAHQAIEKTWYRCHKSYWLLEVDIKRFFDNVDHELVFRALEHLKVPRWVKLYCDRWLKAPMVDKQGNMKERGKGTPQGGVISPVLANLILHYSLDEWLKRKYAGVEFARYADDLVIHCKNYSEGKQLKFALVRRLKEVGLEMNLTKSRLVYLGTYPRWNVATEFTFLGYDFKYRTLKDSRDGSLFRKMTPGASKKALKRIVAEIKSWKIHRSTTEEIQEFAWRHNATIRGWIGYYGKFWYRNFSYRLWTALQSRILKWIKAKYRKSNKRARRYLAHVQAENPKLFAHWYLLQEGK